MLLVIAALRMLQDKLLPILDRNAVGSAVFATPTYILKLTSTLADKIGCQRPETPVSLRNKGRMSFSRHTNLGEQSVTHTVES